MLEQTLSYQAVETQSEEKSTRYSQLRWEKTDSNFWGYSCSLKYAESSTGMKFTKTNVCALDLEVGVQISLLNHTPFSGP